MPRLYGFIPVAICLAGLLASGIILQREARTYVRPFNTSPEFAGFMSYPKDNYGPSIFSKQIALLDCTYALTSGLNDPLVLAGRNEVTAQCRRTSDLITASMPSYGLAWYVRALAAASTGDDEAFDFSLQMSQRVSPQEQWLAKSRVDVGEVFISKLDADNLKRHNADIALLVSSRSRIDSVALQYQRNAASRERIMQVVSTLPPQTQSDFIKAIRRVIATTNPKPS